MGASSNTEKIGTRYCRKCKRNRKFSKVKLRVGYSGVSYGHPTQYVCSKGHVYDEYPPRARR